MIDYICPHFSEMKTKILIIKILTFFFALTSSAQYVELGVFGGGSMFMGDVGHGGLQLPSGYAYGGFIKYNFNEHWAVRGSVNYGFIQSADADSKLDYEIDRNLSFQSNILEGSLMGEFNFLEYRPGSKHNFTPYLLGGFGLFSFKPEAEYEGQMYSLREMGTEGQNTSASNEGFYPQASSFFVFGLGFKWAINNYTSLGIESTFRQTRTDYLDDVSGKYADPDIIEAKRGPVAAALSDRSLNQTDKTYLYRGDPSNDDWYMFVGVTIQFKIGELYEKCSNFIVR